MTVFRSLGLLVVVLLCACDAHEPPAPKPKTEAAQSAAPVPAAPVPPVVPSTVEKPVAEAVTGAAGGKREAPAVHELTPNVPVKPVVLDKSDFGAVPKVAQDSAASAKGAKTDSKAPAKTVAKAQSKEQKRKAEKTPAKDVRIGKAKLDLSLPQELVRELEPPANVISGRRKPLLPPMFDDKPRTEPGSFELGGRLLSNEMQLQMRNDSRRDVEGAALDFKFKQ